MILKGNCVEYLLSQLLKYEGQYLDMHLVIQLGSCGFYKIDHPF